MSIRTKLRGAVKFTLDSDYRFYWLAMHHYYDDMPDEEYLRRLWHARMGYDLDLGNPKTFNEKLQWLKLYDRKPIYTTMVDKYEAKKYVAGIIGEEHIIPTYGVWNHFDDINFDLLPEQFVLKCTHDSGGLVICRDKNKLDKVAAKEKLEKCLRRNYYLQGREWPYKNVKPRILAEKYIANGNHELMDYKLMCFNGKVCCSFTCTERFSENGLKVTFFDNDWNVMPFERHYPKSEKPIEKPIHFDQMIECAERLSKGIPFVRVDFYEVSGTVFFGELTFYPGNGLEEFTPVEWDYRLGDWLKLPEKSLEGK